MSLGIITTTNEGNVLAADSMETYLNAINDVREGSQTRLKILQLNKRVGVIACGLSFFENKSIHQHLLRFKKLFDLEPLLVAEIVDKLYDFIFEQYQNHLITAAERKKQELVTKGHKNVQYSFQLENMVISWQDPRGQQYEQKSSQPIIEFLVAGYNPDKTNAVYKITIPDAKTGNGIVLRLSKDQCGAAWIGQTDVLARIVRGWSPEIKGLKVLSELPKGKKEELLQGLDDQEYIINWAGMSLQDAVTFADLGIKTTEAIQRITDGTWQFPGSSPGVGGPIDIAIITPEKGFVWFQKKKLQLGDSELDLET